MGGSGTYILSLQFPCFCFSLCFPHQPLLQNKFQQGAVSGNQMAPQTTFTDSRGRGWQITPPSTLCRNV